MVCDVRDDRPCVVDSRPTHTGRQAHDWETGVALWDWFLWISTDAFSRIAGNLDFAEHITRALEVVRPKRLRLGLVVDPYDHSFSVAAIGCTHTETDSDVVSIGP